jgi:beta-glucanase (GH16 family)
MIFGRSTKTRTPLALRVFPQFCAMAAALTCGAGAAQADWQLTWSDEFNGSSVDTNHWSFDIGTGNNGWGNNELQYYTARPQNACVSKGLLHIVAQRDSYQGSHYTSAKMRTRGHFSQTYGRFEIRARLPQGKGYWPAFWLMPEDAAYGPWAASGEIDVMENKGANPTNIMGTIHFGGIYPRNTHSQGPSYTFPAGDSVTNFHVYAVEWTSNAIRWYVDDHLYETQTAWWSSSGPASAAVRNPYPAPFNQAFSLILNLAVGGNFDGNPDGSTVFPGEMQVDYVRVYHETPGRTTPAVQSRLPLQTASMPAPQSPSRKAGSD